GSPGGVHPDPLAYLLPAHFLTDQGENERLGHTHDRELVVGVSAGIDSAIRAHHADPEQRAWHAGQRRIDLRVLAFTIGLVALVRLGHQGPDLLRERQATGGHIRRAGGRIALRSCVHRWLLPIRRHTPWEYQPLIGFALAYAEQAPLHYLECIGFYV